METLSALLVLCERNPPVTGGRVQNIGGMFISHMNISTIARVMVKLAEYKTSIAHKIHFRNTILW